MNANVDETRCGSKTSATRKNHCPRYRVRKTNIRRRKRESARSPLGCHVNVDVKVTSVSVSVCQYVRVRRSYNLNVAMFWAMLMFETA